MSGNYYGISIDGAKNSSPVSALHDGATGRETTRIRVSPARHNWKQLQDKRDYDHYYLLLSSRLLPLYLTGQSPATVSKQECRARCVQCGKKKIDLSLSLSLAVVSAKGNTGWTIKWEHVVWRSLGREGKDVTKARARYRDVGKVG